MLRGKTLEEIVNRWTSDLETNVREFNKFAAEVAVWDRALIENGNNVGYYICYRLLSLIDKSRRSLLYIATFWRQRNSRTISTNRWTILNNSKRTLRQLWTPTKKYHKRSWVA